MAKEGNIVEILIKCLIVITIVLVVSHLLFNFPPSMIIATMPLWIPMGVVISIFVLFSTLVISIFIINVLAEWIKKASQKILKR